jgi:hypothetical protein
MIDQKQEEYQLMQNSAKRTIKVQIPNGPELVCHNSWDYKTNLKETSLKTLTEITRTHPMLSVEELNLFPVTNTKMWIVKVLRQPNSNLKNVPRQAKGSV